MEVQTLPLPLKFGQYEINITYMNNLIFLKKNNQIIQYTKNIQTILHFEKDENNNKIPILDENQIITGFKHYFTIY